MNDETINGIDCADESEKFCILYSSQSEWRFSGENIDADIYAASSSNKIILFKKTTFRHTQLFIYLVAPNPLGAFILRAAQSG